MARIILESGGDRKEFRIFGPLTLGRKKDNEVFLDDPDLSREHSRVAFEGRAYFLSDLDSRNGTFLNGKKISGAEMLRPGDRFRLGKNTFLFELTEDDAGLPADVRTPRSEVPAPFRPPSEAIPLEPGPSPSAPAAPAKPTTAAVRLPRDREKEPLQVQGPSIGTRLLLWWLLLMIFAGALYGAKQVFVWALHRAVQP